jgi:hypothetical protein
MEKNLFTISVTIINFVGLIAIIFIIVKLIVTFINKSKGGEDSNKKNYKISMSIFIIILIGGYFYYTFPQRINLTYNGIKYKIGNQQQQEQVKISITGFYYNKFFTKDCFEGSINIDNEGYPRLKLLVGEELQMISYRDHEGDGKVHTYGEIFIGRNFKDLTICVQDGQNGWNRKNGLMVSAPAKNRVEAVKISNRLMKNVLKRRYKNEME